jgi:hypothetical protein
MSLKLKNGQIAHLIHNKPSFSIIKLILPCSNQFDHEKKNIYSIKHYLNGYSFTIAT